MVSLGAEILNKPNFILNAALYERERKLYLAEQRVAPSGAKALFSSQVHSELALHLKLGLRGRAQ